MTLWDKNLAEFFFFNQLSKRKFFGIWICPSSLPSDVPKSEINEIISLSLCRKFANFTHVILDCVGGCSSKICVHECAC